MDPTSNLLGTSANKAIVALIIPLIAWANQRWGLALPVDESTLLALVGLVTTVAVFLVPNRVNTSQAAAVVAASKNDPVVQAKVKQLNQGDTK